MSRDPFDVPLRSFLAALVVVLALACAAGYGFMSLMRLAAPAAAPEIQPPAAPLFGPSAYDRLVAFYAGCQPDCAKVENVAQAVAHTEDAAAILCVDDQVKTLLAMWHRESNFNPKTDDGNSYGIAQVRRRYERRLRKAWAKLGVRLGPRTEIRTQIYMGVMVYRDKLREAQGLTFGAVRRYNGSGDRAELYAYKVLASRGRIFPDAPWIPDETTTLYKECP